MSDYPDDLDSSDYDLSEPESPVPEDRPTRGVTQRPTIGEVARYCINRVPASASSFQDSQRGRVGAFEEVLAFIFRLLGAHPLGPLRDLVTALEAEEHDAAAHSLNLNDVLLCAEAIANSGTRIPHGRIHEEGCRFCAAERLLAALSRR